MTGRLPFKVIHNKNKCSHHLCQYGKKGGFSREGGHASHLAMTEDIDSHSWTMLGRELLFMYGFPSGYSILASSPSRLRWKNLLKRSVHDFWLEKLKAEALLKSTHKFLSLDSCIVGKEHPLWQCGHDLFEVTMVYTNAQLAVLRYGLYNRGKSLSNVPYVVDRRQWSTSAYTVLPCNKSEPH